MKLEPFCRCSYRFLVESQKYVSAYRSSLASLSPLPHLSHGGKPVPHLTLPRPRPEIVKQKCLPGLVDRHEPPLVYILLKRIDKAHDVAERALRIAVDHGEQGYEAWARKVLGDLMAAEGNLERSEAYYSEARESAQNLSMKPLAALCDFGAATVRYRLGDRHGASAMIRRAQRDFLNMGMRFWVARCQSWLSEPGD